MDLSKLNILVTGGAGFVGTNLLKRLVEMNCRPRATIHNTPPQFVDQNIDYITCDLMDKKDCDKVMSGIDIVFICSANTSGAVVIENTPLAHVTPNVIMNTLLLDAAYQSGVKKVLFISSNTVYPLTDYAVSENDVTGEFFHKYFCVAWMKLFSETLCQMYATKIKRTMKTVVIRPGNLYGEYDDFDWETAHVIPALVRKVVERQNPICVWGDGSEIKDLLYVDDFIDGLLLAIEKLDSYDPINIAAGNSVSVKDLINVIAEQDCYADCDIQFDPSKPTMIPKRLINIDKARKVLGFEPKTPLSIGIKNTIEWYRSQHDR